MALFPTLPGVLRNLPRRERMRSWEEVGRAHRGLWMAASLLSNVGGILIVWLGIVLQGKVGFLSSIRPVLAVAITCSVGLVAGYLVFRLLFFRRVERAAEAYFAGSQGIIPPSAEVAAPGA